MIPLKSLDVREDDTFMEEQKERIFVFYKQRRQKKHLTKSVGQHFPQFTQPNEELEKSPG